VTTQTETTQKGNRLNRREFFLLCDGIRTHLDALNKGKMSHARAAEYLSGRLGFKVSERNMSCAAEAIGATWERPRDRTKETRKEIGERVESLEKKVQALQAHVESLEENKTDVMLRAIYLLFHKLGEPLPREMPTTQPNQPRNGVITKPVL
jgi:hypothetical protein